MYLGAMNCIYSDGSVVSLDQGPCADPGPSGADLVDAEISETNIDVTTSPPADWGLLLLLGLGVLLIGGFHVSR